MPTLESNPLTEANPESLAEIFEKDPLSLTDDDIDRTVLELRSMRDKWNLAEKKGKPKKEVVAVNLEDLGL